MADTAIFPMISRQQAITNIIQSVATEQTAIAGILDTQKAHYAALKEIGTLSLAETNLCNKCEQELINAATRLEMILQMKLDLFAECLCEGTTPPKPGDSTQTDPPQG